jgi:single-strand DNA-binding protein
MSGFNKVLLIGNLTRDPEIKYTTKGTAVAEVGLAVNRSYTADNGEKREEVTFVDITFWGRQAEVLEEYCKKGKQLHVEGRLQLDTWDDKQTGQKRYKLRVVGENFVMLADPSGRVGAERRDHSNERGGPPARGNGPSSHQSKPANPPPQQKPPPDPDLDPADDDIPF